MWAEAAVLRYGLAALRAVPITCQLRATALAVDLVTVAHRAAAHAYDEIGRSLGTGAGRRRARQRSYRAHEQMPRLPGRRSRFWSCGQ